MLLNIIHAHLSRDFQHHRADCRERCVEGCDVRAFEQWLAAPILASERRTEEERERRLIALQQFMRGGFRTA